jgi:hypothetical protein
MPTFDGGHYFLTALIPICKETIKDGDSGTSPVHALRKVLDMLPTAAETPADGGGQSPFARNKRNHFARLVIIDDLAYNGRDPRNTLVTAIIKENLMVAQSQDHLSCPFLLFSADFDAKTGADSARDSYLAELWTTMSEELKEIFQFCQGFSDEVTDQSSFAVLQSILGSPTRSATRYSRGNTPSATKKAWPPAAARSTGWASGALLPQVSSCSDIPTRPRKSLEPPCLWISAATAPLWPIASFTRTLWPLMRS